MASLGRGRIRITSSPTNGRRDGHLSSPIVSSRRDASRIRTSCRSYSTFCHPPTKTWKHTITPSGIPTASPSTLLILNRQRILHDGSGPRKNSAPRIGPFCATRSITKTGSPQRRKITCLHVGRTWSRMILKTRTL